MSNYMLCVKNVHFAIISKHQSYIVKSIDTCIQCSWLDKLNYQVVSKKYNVDKIKQLIVKLCNKNPPKRVFNIDSKILCIKEKNRITQSSITSPQSLDDTKNGFYFHNCNFRNITIPTNFGKKNTIDIIISEYMILYKCLLNNTLQIYYINMSNNSKIVLITFILF